MKFFTRIVISLTFLIIYSNVYSQQKPNVIIMLADNLGYGDLGCYGSGGAMRGMPTPRIDKLADEGLKLTQFFVEPGCTPSRAGLLTGRYSVRSGLGSIIVAGTPCTLKENEITIAELLKEEGYYTGIVGKWHLGQEKQSLPTNQGFDEYKVGILETTDGVLYPETMMRSGLSDTVIEKTRPYIWESIKGKKELKKVRPYDLEYRKFVEEDIAKASINFIKKQAKNENPFFLYVGWSHVHYPGLSHPDFEGKSSSGPYGDMVMELDYRTGQILDALRESGQEDNTIVIWLSDNGPVQAQGTNNDFMGSSPGPFRGEIGDALEGSLRVPAIIKWPNKIPPSVSNEMVAIYDFFPTISAILGKKLPQDRPIDGKDQFNFFTGKSSKSSRESVITFIDGEIAAVRWRQWRIYPKQFAASEGVPSQAGIGAYRIEGTGYPAIYNIERDPRELWNQVGVVAWVINPYLKIVAEYKKSLVKYPNPPAFKMTSFD